jgi:inorganic triphosphatase YgiF
MRRELELKVELSKSDMERLAGDLPGADVEAGPASTQKIKTVYFDTPEHNLHAAGMSLRLRRQNGHWLQTLKAEQQVADGVSNPIELEAPVDAEEPDVSRIADKKLKRAVQQAVKGTTLHPVFETIVKRTTRTLKARESEIELAVDDGEVRAGEASQELREAELELKSGTAEGLLLAAETLLSGHELRLSRRSSKAERGYRLAQGKTGTTAEPLKASPVHLGRDDTCRKAFVAILASATQQVVVNREVVLTTDDPQGAHQLRIGLRRLRSALYALRPLANGTSLQAFERCARDMGRHVAALRDADVLIADIHAPMEAVSADKAGFATLHDALVEERQTRRDELRTILGGPVWTRLQLYLTLWPRTLEEHRRLDKPIAKHARKVLTKAWKTSAHYGARLERLDEAHRHEMRKALKKLRYQIEFLAPLYKARKAEGFVRQLKALQDIFGYVNDVTTAPRLQQIARQRTADCDAAGAAGYIVGRHEAQAAHEWKKAGKAWRRLERTPQFWLGR